MKISESNSWERFYAYPIKGMRSREFQPYTKDTGRKGRQTRDTLRKCPPPRASLSRVTRDARTFSIVYIYRELRHALVSTTSGGPRSTAATTGAATTTSRTSFFLRHTKRTRGFFQARATGGHQKRVPRSRKRRPRIGLSRLGAWSFSAAKRAATAPNNPKGEELSSRPGDADLPGCSKVNA